MQFKDFEIRPVKSLDGVIDPKRFELVKWYDHEPYIHGTSTSTHSCYTVAWLEYDNKDGFWNLRSVGPRLMENWADGLNEFIIKWCDLMTVCIEEGDDDEDG